MNFDRFFKHVKMTKTCWLWIGAKDPGGYGHYKENGKCHLAHRQAWRMFRCEIPEGYHVLHVCDVQNCVNPGHLFIGTHADNMADKARKGRTSHCPGRRKLNDQEEDIICTSALSNKAAARLYGVDPATIRQIKRRHDARRG